MSFIATVVLLPLLGVPSSSASVEPHQRTYLKPSYSHMVGLGENDQAAQRTEPEESVGPISDTCLAQVFPEGWQKFGDDVVVSMATDVQTALDWIPRIIRQEFDDPLADAIIEGGSELLALFDELSEGADQLLTALTDDECEKEIVSAGFMFLPIPLGKTKALALVRKADKVVPDVKLRPKVAARGGVAVVMSAEQKLLKRVLHCEADWPAGKRPEDFFHLIDGVDETAFFAKYGRVPSKAKGDLGEAFAVHRAELDAHEVVATNVDVEVAAGNGKWVKTECDLLLRVADTVHCREIKTGRHAKFSEAQHAARVGGTDDRIIRIADPHQARALGLETQFSADLTVHCYGRTHVYGLCSNWDQLDTRGVGLSDAYPGAVSSGKSRMRLPSVLD